MSKGGGPLVSVIVPVYNVEKYLKACVESIIGQIYENLEIILVDDGSPDRSGEMCDELAKSDSRIKVVHKQNEGLNFARKTGFENSTGEFILLVDSDDMLRQDAVRSLVESIRETSVDVVIGGYERFSDGDNPDSTKPVKNRYKVLDSDTATKGLLLGAGLENVLMMTAWGRLYKRSVIASIDWEASNYRSNEDEFMALQYFSKLKNDIAVIQDGLYLYRDNPNSITRGAYKNSFNGKDLDRFNTIERIYLEANRLLDKKYSPLILAKFIYEFIIVLYKELQDDSDFERVSRAVDEYFKPKQALIDDEVLSNIDPLTLAQYRGLVERGAVGCVRAKLEFIERENDELRSYQHNLENSIVEKNQKIADLSGQVARYVKMKHVLRHPLRTTQKLAKKIIK